MSNATEVNATPAPINPQALEQEIERLLKVAAERHGLSYDVVKTNYYEAAKEQAIKTFEKADEDASNPYRRLYGESQDRIKQLEAQLQATQQSRVRSNEHVIVTTVEQVQKRDPLGWHKMTPEQRLAAIGVDHTTLDKKELAQLFGKNSNHKAASDLMRVDQRRYRTLREAAKVLNVY